MTRAYTLEYVNKEFHFIEGAFRTPEDAFSCLSLLKRKRNYIGEDPSYKVFGWWQNHVTAAPIKYEVRSIVDAWEKATKDNEWELKEQTEEEEEELPKPNWGKRC